MDCVEVIQNEEINITTKNEYRGENQRRLHESRLENHYEEPLWGTFLQWKKLGRKIIKGEKGIRLFHPTKMKFEKEDGSIGFKDSRKYFVVFNYSQTSEKERNEK